MVRHPTIVVEGNKRQVRHVIGLILGAIALGYVVPRLPVPYAFLSALATDEIIAFLSAVSSGMMAFTGIVFSLLFVLLQFGTTAYTPRIVDILGRQKVFYEAAGVFAGTFLYSLMALRGVGEAGNGRTSQVPMLVAYGWLLASVWLLLKLVASVAGMTHTAILHMLADTGQQEADRAYRIASSDGVVPRETPVLPDEPRQRILHSGGMRYLVGLDVERLADVARSFDAVVRVPFSLGDPVAPHSALALVYRSGEPIPEELLRPHIHVARERVLENNPKYAIRLLVDIAIRSLSPAVNDPTTAVQTLDHLEALLHTLAQYDLDIGRTYDAAGKLRVVQEVTSWADYVDLSLTEIQQYGAGAVQVERRIAALLAFLIPVVPARCREALEGWATRQRLALDASTDVRIFRDEAQLVDRQGLGHTWTAGSQSR
jgi:uncharacterized membrane protein